MKIEFDKSFLKSIDKLGNPQVNSKLQKIIVELENADTIHQMVNVVKLSGFQNYYRIRIGDYRLGFELLAEDTLRLIIIAHRKDVYKVFP